MIDIRKRAKNNKIVTYSLPKNTIKALEITAKKQDRSKSRIVNAALKEYIIKHGDGTYFIKKQRKTK